MGLFSTRYKTYVGTTVSRLIQDEALPDSSKTGVMKAILNNGSIPEYVMEDLVTCLGVRAERMYAYAEDNYTHGLPTATLYTSSVGVAQVGAVLAGITGGPVEVQYSHLGAPNALHFGWMQAMALHGYDPATNMLGPLTAQHGKDTFMEDMVVIVPQNRLADYSPHSLEQWGPSPQSGPAPSRAWMVPVAGGLVGHSPVVADPENGPEKIALQWVYEDLDQQPDGMDSVIDPFIRGAILIPFTGPMAINTADYFHVKYIYNGQTRYWMYRAGSGGHPTLDRLVSKPIDALGSFFPFAYFRYDKASEITDTSTESYKTTKKMLKMLGIDYDTVATAIDENPDVADVEQAMLIMAVPANTEDPQEMAYLYSFFEKLYFSRGQQNLSSVATDVSQLLGEKTEMPRYAVGIEDKRFKMALSDAGLYKSRRVGTLPGPYGMGTGEKTVMVPYHDPEHGGITYQPYVIKYHYYRKQVSRFMYDELEVVDLQMMYQVLEGYATTADETDDILLVPLDKSITEDYSILDRERLYARSLHFVFNSSVVQKIKWYQTDWFGAVLTFIGIVVVIVSWGTNWEVLAAALAIGTAAALTAATLTILMNLLTAMFYSYLLKLFVKEVGIEAALVIAIVAAAFGYGMSEGGVQGLQGAPWAKQLLELASGISKAAVDSMKDDMSNLLAEYESFNLMKDAATKELEAANKLLEHNNRLDPFTIFGESPDAFYNRTVHSGNTGMAGISAISSYVDIALTLPTLSSTIGESQYG
jgi:hypothetical protein